MKKNAYIFTLSQCLFIALALSFATSSSAIHLDVEVWAEDDTVSAGFCRTPGVIGCDLGSLFDGLGLASDTLPREATSGKLIFISDFQDLSGGPYKTKNPGFQSIRNALLPNELLSYRALGTLRYWDSSLAAWTQAPQNVRIALYGGLEASTGLATDYTACTGQLLCFDADNFNTDSYTVFSGDGISGSPELAIDITNDAGILHTHLSFFLENALGELGGSDGAYLLEIQILSNARTVPSEPFLILFNAGLNNEQFAGALSALIGDLNIPGTPTQENLPTTLSIQGDVDLDGDVDRLDVALILLAAQNQDVVQANNVMFDVDRDGLISRQDSHLAKSLCSLRLCQIPSAVQAQPIKQLAEYDTSTGQLTLNDVQVDTQHFQAILTQSDQTFFTLQSLLPAEIPYAIPVQYSANSSLLEIPALFVDNRYYQVTLRHIGDLTFRLENIKEINN